MGDIMILIVQIIYLYLDIYYFTFFIYRKYKHKGISHEQRYKK